MDSNTALIKNNLHKLIVETDDENILSKVQAYFNTLKSADVDWWDSLSDEEKYSVEKAQTQLADGEGIPYEKVKAKADRILKRK